MGKEVKLKKSELMLTAEGIKSSGEDIKHSVSKILEPTKCSDIMVFSYHDRIKQIAILLSKYKELLEKDIVDIKAAIDHIEKTDEKIAGNMTSGTSSESSTKKKTSKKK